MSKGGIEFIHCEDKKEASKKALAQIDEFIILVFGDNEQGKKEVLRKMFQGDDQKFLPAVFYTNVPIEGNYIYRHS